MTLEISILIWYVLLLTSCLKVDKPAHYIENQTSQQKKKRKKKGSGGRQNSTWEGWFFLNKNGMTKWTCVWIYTHLYAYINTTRMSNNLRYSLHLISRTLATGWMDKIITFIIIIMAWRQQYIDIWWPLVSHPYQH